MRYLNDNGILQDKAPLPQFREFPEQSLILSALFLHKADIKVLTYRTIPRKNFLNWVRETSGLTNRKSSNRQRSIRFRGRVCNDFYCDRCTEEKKKSRKENAKDKHHDYVYYTLINTFAK